MATRDSNPIKSPDDETPRATAPTSAPSTNKIVLAACALFALTVGLFLPATGNGFVGFDDPDYVTSNPHVLGGLTAGNVAWAFSHATAANWHPLTWLSHMIDVQCFGLQPWGHHLTSVLLHALNVVLVFLLFYRLTGGLASAFLVAALFGAHPLRVESVAWVSERKDVLSACFFLLTLLAYERYIATSKVRSPKSKVSYGLALVFFIGGLLSKPMLVTLPFVLLLLDFWPFKRLAPNEGAAGPVFLLREKIPFFSAAAAVSVVTFLVQQHGGAAATARPWMLRCENSAVSYGRYLGKMFWPTRLAAFYPYPDHWPPGIVLFACAGLAGVTIFVIARRRSAPCLATGWFWFLGMLVPVIGLVPAGDQAMADRYSYLPSLGILLMLVCGARAIAKRPGVATALSIAAGAAIVVCAAITHARIADWRDTETLFRRALAVTQHNYLAHYNLGTALDRQDRISEAMAEFKAAVQDNPSYAPAHNNLGLALAKSGGAAEALAEYQEAIRLDPGNSDAHNNLGVALEKSGRLDDALREYAVAVALNPQNAAAHSNMGIGLARSGRLVAAIPELQRAAELQPDLPEAHGDLGVALDRAGQFDTAIAEYRRALELKPDYPRAHFNLGVTLARKGLLNEAADQFREALRLNPDYVEARKNLELITAEKGVPGTSTKP